jgi:DivIVA domain-containing protein
MPPTTERETRSAYVVQRHFRRVRKGYDPAEVDRHLQVVSEWFRTSRTAEHAREVEQQLLARERAVVEKEAEAEQLLESTRLEAKAILEGAQLRATADREAADALLAKAREDARAEAAEIVDQARLEAAAADVLRQAKAEAELQAYIQRRHREVDRLVEAARRDRRRASEDSADT